MTKTTYLGELEHMILLAVLRLGKWARWTGGDGVWSLGLSMGL
jgi:hypothetical protein